MRVGIVGTGEMGRPLVDRLVAAGLDVTAFARRGEARSELESVGINCVGTPADLARDRDIVIVYVHSDEQLRDIVLHSGLGDAMERDSILVVHTTGNPQTIETIQRHLETNGVGVVDAPGSGGPQQVAEGALTLFVGGSDEHVQRCTPLFAAYAAEVVHFGGPGAGQKVKLLNNLLFGAHVELAVQAAELSDAFGIDPVLVAKSLHTGSGASYALDLVAAMGSADALVAGAGRFVHKDVIVARAAAKEVGASIGSLEPVTDAVLERTSERH
jgi:3-hydroxyisobutyrate dehydrogenase-like beta-hydroxyacid dehydrogenase